MTVKTQFIDLKTPGEMKIVEVTADVTRAVQQSTLKDGIVTLFSPSSTSSITTIEYEPGCLKDFQRLFDEIADPNRSYAHNQTAGDGNGYSHIRASLLGPTLTVPFNNGKLGLGIWQRIIYIDFDNKPRQRKIQIQIIGE